jgi:large subunit ribosomal protein L4
MVRLALCSALSDRAADGKVIVIDAWDIESPKTKDAVAALASLEVEGKVLLVLGEDDDAVWKSCRNLGDVHCLYARELNAYDVLVSDTVVFTQATLPGSSSAPAETAVDIATDDDATDGDATDGDATDGDATDGDAEVTE